MFDMLGNYESRKVARYESGKLEISTARVTDSSFPYETAVSHPNYNGGSFVVVENYNTKKEAQQGHEKWVKIMTTSPLPERLWEASQSWVGQLTDIVLQDESWRDKAEV